MLIDLVEHGVAVRVLEGSDAGDYDEMSDVREGAREITEIRRSLLSESIKDGLQAARDRGNLGGRPRVVDRTMRATIFAERNEGETIRSIARSLSVSVGTVHAVLGGKCSTCGAGDGAARPHDPSATAATRTRHASERTHSGD